MKPFDELTRDEIIELKCALLLQMNDSVKFKDYCNADSLVSDKQVKDWYEDNSSERNKTDG